MKTEGGKNSVYGSKTLSDAGLQDIFFLSPLSFVCIKIYLSFVVMFVQKKTFLSHIDFFNTGRHDYSAEIESVFVILYCPLSKGRVLNMTICQHMVKTNPMFKYGPDKKYLKYVLIAFDDPG